MDNFITENMGIILQGNVEYNGMDVCFVISRKKDKDIDVQISFVNGSKKAENNFSLIKVPNEEQKWMLDTSKQQSDIDVYFEKKKNKFILSASEPDIKMVFDPKLNELCIVDIDDKEIFNFNRHNAFDSIDRKMNINFDKAIDDMSLFDKLIFSFSGAKKDVDNAFNDLFNKTNNKEKNDHKDNFTSTTKPLGISNTKNNIKLETQLLEKLNEIKRKEDEMTILIYKMAPKKCEKKQKITHVEKLQNNKKMVAINSK